MKVSPSGRNASAFLVPRRCQFAQIVVGLAKDADKGAEEAARKKLDDVAVSEVLSPHHKRCRPRCRA